MVDVVNIGLALMDIPIKLSVSAIDFTADALIATGVRMTTGGDAANVSVILSQLGCRTALCAAVGDDIAGRTVVDILAQAGVDVSCVRRRADVPTTISCVLINGKGDRTFVGQEGSSETLCREDFDDALLCKTRHINYGSFFRMPIMDRDIVDIFQKAKNAGLTLSADTVMDRHHLGLEGIAEALSYLDIFMPSYIEGRLMTGETDAVRIARRIVSKTGEKYVVIKLGEEGCFVHEPAREYRVRAFPAHAVDTTGAGDSFVAGVIKSYLDGRPFEDCVRYGSAVGALNIAHVGATHPSVTDEAVEAILSKMEI
jgi:sugar/nucleoside kinase (ribokinase family)